MLSGVKPEGAHLLARDFYSDLRQYLQILKRLAWRPGIYDPGGDAYPVEQGRYGSGRFLRDQLISIFLS